MLSSRSGERGSRLALAGIRAALIVGWGSVSYVLVALEPEIPMNVVGLLASFLVASGSTVALVAYWLSFRVFSDRAFRGNAAVCAVQGIAAGLALALALGLQIARAPLAATLAVGVSAFVAGQAAVLLRARDRR
jgi:hypothetical protein